MGKVFGLVLTALAVAVLSFLVSVGLLSFTLAGLHEHVSASVPALGFWQTGWVVLFLIIAGGAWNSSLATRLSRRKS